MSSSVQFESGNTLTLSLLPIFVLKRFHNSGLWFLGSQRWFISLKEKTFSFEPEVTIKLSKKKLKFFEVPITYNGRSYEEGKKIGLKDAFIALKTIILYSLKN